VIEVDGTNTLCVSVLINTTDPLGVGNYWIRATMVDMYFNTLAPMNDSLAILHYSDAVVQDPTMTQSTPIFFLPLFNFLPTNIL